MLKSLDKLNYFFLNFLSKQILLFGRLGFCFGVSLFGWLAFGLCVYPFFTFAILEHEY